MTLATAQARLEAIDEAIAGNTLFVSFSDRSTTYRSIDSLMTARAHYAGLVAQLSGRSKQTLAYGSKGW